MLCYAMLCYAILCYAILCYAMLYYAMLYYAILYYAMLYYAMLCYLGQSIPADESEDVAEEAQGELLCHLPRSASSYRRLRSSADGLEPPGGRKYTVLYCAALHYTVLYCTRL